MYMSWLVRIVGVAGNFWYKYFSFYHGRRCSEPRISCCIATKLYHETASSVRYAFTCFTLWASLARNTVSCLIHVAAIVLYCSILYMWGNHFWVTGTSEWGCRITSLQLVGKRKVFCFSCVRCTMGLTPAGTHIRHVHCFFYHEYCVNCM